METRIQLHHPAGKKAVSMDENKYEILKKIILNQLKAQGELSHTEILRVIINDFKKQKTTFPGSIEWHMEWVKLDLEANKLIERVPGKTGIKFRLTN